MVLGQMVSKIPQVSTIRKVSKMLYIPVAGCYFHNFLQVLKSGRKTGVTFLSFVILAAGMLNTCITFL
jgi:hypothetical protein